MSQSSIVLKHLKNAEGLSQYEATKKYGIIRLGAIIHKLKQEGHRIRTELHKSGQGGNYAVYFLD
jgi:hypothetical protein